LLCEQLGQEPDPAKMPLEPSDFPEEVQVAFFMFSLLPDRWEGMSGTYMGKDWTPLEYAFKIYKVYNEQEVFYFMKMYENIIVAHKHEKGERAKKAEARKTPASGGNYTHNVKG